MTHVEKKTQQTTDYSELPQELIDAHADGRVVFFVGAGASCASPSKLPLFKDLAEKMGEEAESPYQEGEPIDTFLGRLTSLKPPYNVHKRAKVLLDPPGSRPNDIHKTIVRLAFAYNRFRVVTTNFDLHLEKAAEDEKIKIPDIWNSPALPLGDQMEGLVHLHGSVTRSPNELILTDRDLGRAYLYEAWATRFLRTLFQENVVVFIGYGLNDPTMRYLTLALPSNASLYAFLHEDEVKGQDWKRLNVKTISFGCSYENLLPSLQNWLNLVKGKEAYRNRFDRIVSSGVDNLTEADDSFLSMLFSSVAAAKGFVEATDSVSEENKLEWLHWLEARSEFKRLFKPELAVRDNEALDVLGCWFVKNFIASPDLHGAAFKTMQKVGQSMSVSLYQKAFGSVVDLARKDRDAARRWKAFLLTSVVGRSLNFPEDRWLFADGVPEDLFTLRSTLRPYLKIKPPLSGSEYESDEDSKLSEAEPNIPDVEVSWAVGEDLLTKSVQKVVELANSGGPRFGAVLEDSLAQAYEILEAYYGKERSEQNSHICHGIEPREQDQFRSECDAVVDGLRDYGEKAIRDRRHAGLPSRWWSFERTFFRRLALHLIANDEFRTADEKIEWVLSRKALFEFEVKDELYHTLRVAIGDASEEARGKILVAVENHVPPEDKTFSKRDCAYNKYNLLVWLTTYAPKWEAALMLKDKLEVENNFKPREHPDTDFWTTCVPAEEKPPMSVEEFLAKAETNVQSLLDDLLSFDYSEWKIYGPSWGGLVSLFQEAVERSPSTGIALWKDLVARGVVNGTEDTKETSRKLELFNAVIDGWAKAEMGESLFIEVVQLVSSCVEEFGSADSIGRFLVRQIEKRIESGETESVAKLRKLAKGLFCEQVEKFTYTAKGPTAFNEKILLNAWPSSVVLYWIKEVDRRGRRNKFDNIKLTEEEENAFTSFLTAPQPVLDIAEPAIASNLSFIHAVDAKFARENIFTLFKKRDSFKNAWLGYFSSPCFNDEMLNDGFFELVFEQWSELEDIKANSRDRFFELVVCILSCSNTSEENLQRMANRSVTVGGGSYSTTFAKTVKRLLKNNDIDSAKVWNRWLGKHIKRRIEGLPRDASDIELICWIEVVNNLDETKEEAVNLLYSYDRTASILKKIGDLMRRMFKNNIK